MPSTWTEWISPAWRIARGTATGRRRRTALLVLAVTAAAALLTAVTCAVASVQRSLEDGIASFIGAADARIVHPASARFDAMLLEAVHAWPEVEQATGRLLGSLELGEVDRAPYVAGAIGLDFAAEGPFRRFMLLDGAAPAAPDEILLDPIAAEALGAATGGELRVRGDAGEATLRVCGVYDRQRFGAMMAPRVYVDRTVLARLVRAEGSLSAIYMILRDEPDVAAFCTSAADRVPAELLLEPADRARAGFDREVRASRIGMTVATALVFLACSFIIVTGMTTGVLERRRELAVLRAVGASRTHVVAAQLLAGAGHGALGGAIGIPLGIGLAFVLVRIFRELVPSGFVVNGLGLALAGAGSLGAGLLGAVIPAVQAATVRPLDAMRPHARPAGRRAALACTAASAVLLALPLLTRLAPDESFRFWAYVLAGLPGAVSGAFLAGVPVVLLVARALAAPLAAALRLPRDLLAGAIRQSPLRSGFTAGALMIGIALLVNTWTSGMALRDDWLGRIRYAEGFAFRATGFDGAQVQAVRDLPEVEGVLALGRLPARVVGSQVFGIEGLTPRNTVCLSIDSEPFLALGAVEWLDGDPARAVAALRSGTGVLVADRFRTTRRFAVGDPLTLAVGRTERTFEICGVVSSAGIDFVAQFFGLGSGAADFAISCVFLDAATVAAAFGTDERQLLLLDLDDGAPDDAVERAIAAVAPGSLFRSGRAFMEGVRDLAHAAMAVRSTVAFGAMVLASLAVAAVVAAGIETRRFEFGVLRAAGAMPGTLVRTVLGETVLLALSGAIVGTGLGGLLSWMDAQQLRDLAGVAFPWRMPPIPVAIGWLALLLVVIAAALPSVLRLRRRTPAELVTGRLEV